VIFYFASAGASAAYLTVSEILPPLLARGRDPAGRLAAGDDDSHRR
jgi:hypothetical protein